MTLIESKTLGAAAASIEFTSIPQDGTDLLILFSCRGASTTNNDGDYDLLGLQFNSNTTGYSSRELASQIGLSVGSTSRTTLTIGGQAYARFGFGVKNSFNGNTAFESLQMYIPNYTGTTNKSYSVDQVGEGNQTDVVPSIAAGLWSNTEAINSVKFATDNNFVIGSTISLYKITKGSDGIVTTS
jgi:hypothetical protein